MRFTKLHGAGNDFVLVDTRSETERDWPGLARLVCDRHFGVGSDGVLLVRGNPGADLEMVMYNPDGSHSAMCGNGIRCFAKYLYDRGEIGSGRTGVLTGAGPVWIEVLGSDPAGLRVATSLGVPDLDAAAVPTTLAPDMAIEVPVAVAGCQLELTCVSMGNPHAVARVNCPEQFDLARIGPLIEHHPAFPERTNFEVYAPAEDGDGPTLRMRVWERGAGITLACGSGAAATVAAAMKTGTVEFGRVSLLVDGGRLEAEWDHEHDDLILVGPAETAFEGIWDRPAN